MKIFQDKTTDLDLNGPILSFTTEPTGVGSTGVAPGSTGGGTVSITGIATATFPTTADNSGIITYRWYEEGVGALSDSTYITGTATTTLTLSNLITPNDNQRKFYVQADYIPSYYETGNAPNEPFNSGIATVTVDPLIEVIAQPTSQTTIVGTDIRAGVFDTGKSMSLTVNADLSDSYFSNDLTYQWFIDGVAATDGVREKTTTTSSTVSGPVENTYTSPATVSIPSTSSGIEITLAGAAGGNGGNDGNGPGGRGAQGRAGRFAMPDGSKELSIFVGKRGNGGGSGNQPVGGSAGTNNSPSGNGGKGGGAGARGWSGGGGGGGAASYIQNNGSTILVSAGGGGGGGGSHNRAGDSGYNRNPGVGLGYGQGSVGSLSNGAAGENKGSGDGGGAGGSGGGAPGGLMKSAGRDNDSGGEAGHGGASAKNDAQVTLQGSGWLNDADGYANIKYTGNTSTEVTTIRKTVISGSTSATLRLACDTVGIQTAQCKISSATASNSYVMTDEVNSVFVSTTAQNNIRIEAIGVTDTATLTDINLNNGEYTFNIEGTDPDNNGINQFYSLYSNEKDMEVEMDLYGGVGDNKNQRAGGEGGYSRIRFTMEQDKEYVIAGLIASVNTPFLYREGTLMACVGQGGSAGTSGRGGAGGGIDVAGEAGRGSSRGEGGVRISAGSLGGNGIFGSSYSAPTVYPGDTQATGNNGGRAIKCTNGVYWRQQGIGACDTTTTKFRLSDGTEVSNTMTLTRGFKAGYNIMQTAGNMFSSQLGGIGGNGATGGDGTGSNGGGGGGSGYTSGSVTVVDTRLGGSTGNAKVVLRLQS